MVWQKIIAAFCRNGYFSSPRVLFQAKVTSSVVLVFLKAKDEQGIIL